MGRVATGYYLAPGAGAGARAGARRRQAGLTLIEVLIALVILAIGVYAVLKIFPVGFEVINQSRAHTVANSLANAELERWKLLADNMYTLPEAIIAMNYDGTGVYDYNPGSLIPAQYGPTGLHLLWQPDSLWLPRTVVGERIIIPSGAAPLYFLSMAPLEEFRTSPATEAVQVYYAEAFDRVDPGPPAAEEYTIDYATGVVTLDSATYPVGTPFIVTYSWVASDGSVKTQVGEPQDVLAGGTFTLLAAGDAAFARIADDSETVYMALLADATGTPPQGEFYLTPDAIVTGGIVFNPLDAGLQVRVNYRVADWSVLHEDHTVPAGLTIDLALSGIKGPGYKNPPRQPDVLKLPDTDNYVLAVDLADGTVYADQVYAAGQQLLVNYATGEVRFPTGNSGREVRIFYQTRGDWAVQMQKASSDYLPASEYCPDHRHFAWSPGDEAAGLYFAPSERGKVVSVSYRDTVGNYITGELHTIPAATTAPAYIVAPGDNNQVCRVILDNTPAATTAVVAHGVSAAANTVWTTRARSVVPADKATSGRREYLNESFRRAQVSTFLPTPMR